ARSNRRNTTGESQTGPGLAVEPGPLQAVIATSGTHYLDISVVQMRPGKKVGGYGWTSIPARESASRVGDTACAVGQNHKRSTCGKVTAVGVATSIRGYDRDSITNRATYCSYPGDSGGAVYNSSGVLGIVSSGPSNACNDAYVPISLALISIRQSIPSFRLY
ncbi:trypsin-like serine protease, partial [Tsukamurella tyrosinosolvens]